ncbi:MAG: Tn7-like element transposition protein TnsE [Campylobacteraceae bacterium]
MRIKNLEDNIKINFIGSLFKDINHPTWKINLGYSCYDNAISPKDTKPEPTYTNFSNITILSKSRIINSEKHIRASNLQFKTFKLPAKNRWQAESKHYANRFKFPIENNAYITTVEIPQIELARALFFHYTYLSLSSLENNSLSRDFQVIENIDNFTIYVQHLKYEYKYIYEKPEARNILAWILLNQDIKKSYESISSYLIKNNTKSNNYIKWDFQFDQPSLENVKIYASGLTHGDTKTFYIHEIIKIENLPNHINKQVIFYNEDFNKKIESSNQKVPTSFTNQDFEPIIDDDLEASNSQSTRIIPAPKISFGLSNTMSTKLLGEKIKKGSKKPDKEDVESNNYDSTEDVSTDEADIFGDVRKGDFLGGNSTNEEDPEILKDTFYVFVEMLEKFKQNHGINYNLEFKKLHRVSKAKKHLKTDGTYRHVVIATITFNDRNFYMFEVDTSDLNFSLSTRIIEFKNFSTDFLNAIINKILRLTVKNSIKWPIKYIDSKALKNSQFNHPKNISRLKNKKMVDWTDRLIGVLNN